MRINRLTERLLADGWTQDQTPPGCRDWNEFYGGWTYDYRARKDTVFETPCGLLLQRSEVSHSGTMSFRGVDWTEENDNATIICPYYDRTEPCAKNDPRLEETAVPGIAHEILHYCAIHETDRPYDYAKGVRRIIDMAEQEKDRLWNEFSERHNGRVCRYQCRYDRHTKTWKAMYLPEWCASNPCTYCVVLQKEIDRTQKGNVYYDQKTTRKVAEEGVFRSVEQTVVVKGKKLFDKAVPMQICEAVVKYGLHDVKSRLMLNLHWSMYNDPDMKIELVNFRAEKKQGRDLLQDLQDVENGITVYHDADQKKEAAAAKKKRKQEALQKRLAAMERKILDQGLYAFEDFQIERFEKWLGWDRCLEMDEQHRQRQTEQQLSLF